jgi:hypothetical protein
VDKITILEIKLERIAAGKRLANVRAELSALRRVKNDRMPRSERLDELTAALKKVNLALWRIEDQLRICERKADFGAAFIALARSVYRLNDRRARVKRHINALLGAAIVEEKIYAGYQGSHRRSIARHRSPRQPVPKA